MEERKGGRREEIREHIDIHREIGRRKGNGMEPQEKRAEEK